MKKIIETVTLSVLLITNILTAQVAINTDGSAANASAILDLQNSDKGFLPPRMTVAQRNAISNPATGLMIYNTSTKRPNYYSGSQWETFDDTWENCGSTITYSDQIYNTVMIGNKCWMAENLNVGTIVNVVTDQTNNDIIEKYCYDNYAPNCTSYGGLYQWNEMMEYTTVQGVQGICPDGWYLPTDNDWKIMEMALGMSQSEADDEGYRGTNEGTKMKSTSGWVYNGSGTNSSGFNGRPAGFGWGGGFANLNWIGDWWSSSQKYDSSSWRRDLHYGYSQVGRAGLSKTYAISVRCIKD